MTKGETLKIEVTDADAASVEFRFGGASTQTVAGTKVGSLFSIAASTTAWTAGVYAWQAWATYADASKSIISSGTFTLEDVLGVGDVRSQAQKIVEMIDAQMAGNAAEAVRRYKINNRELERYSVAELLQLRSFWQSKVLKETRGNGLGPRIAVRF